MKKVRVLLSLVSSEDDYQHEQARLATETAAKCGTSAEIVYCQSDAIQQGQQLLEAIQSDPRCVPTRSFAIRQEQA
ncbi:MAG TPA: hypothetical protein VG498_20925 [Terriglobales bacterium]|nr:hypothetical protein [Terriglobales bacterium]